MNTGNEDKPEIRFAGVELRKLLRDMDSMLKPPAADGKHRISSFDRDNAMAHSCDVVECLIGILTDHPDALEFGVIQRPDTPGYYESKDGHDVIDHLYDLGWGREFCLGNVMKYIVRAGKKTENPIPDLVKARNYIDRVITKHNELEAE